MPAGQRPLNHHQIRRLSISSVPHPAYYASRLRRRHNRGNHRPLSCPTLPLCLLHIFRQRNRKPGPGNNQIRPGLNRRFHVLPVVPGSHHNIKSDYPMRRYLPGFLKLPANSPQISLQRIHPEIRLPKTDLRRGNNSHAPGLCHSPGQTVEADSHPHSALNHRLFNRKITYYQRIYLSHSILPIKI